ncbi:hypothetical protein [Tranquillimonas alkanivorans]|uniref:Uncharacterized protein n=1 Tax=Tranquillimonas alkanivorans TaxID=441119 RepID=A0A1I5RVA3_9RHOB|nr:hypothetical protein [Tranquillimonas alkanivorans]SFP62492.1 hypothetical protein SAMN04488047_109112 [Tranquillimonas alkanivorans]
MSDILDASDLISEARNLNGMLLMAHQGAESDAEKSVAALASVIEQKLDAAIEMLNEHRAATKRFKAA